MTARWLSFPAGALAALLASGPANAGDAPGLYRALDCLHSALWFVEIRPPVTSLQAPGRTSAAPLVALIDSAVDVADPLIRPHVARAVDLVDGDADPSPPPLAAGTVPDLAHPGDYHGTAMAGFLLARAPAPRLAVYRVLDRQCAGSHEVLARAIELAVGDGARLILLSLGGDARSPSLVGALELAAERGVVVVASAGNSGSGRVSQPARLDGVLSVAAVDGSGHLAPFSAFGPHVSIAERGVAQPVILPWGLRGLMSGTSAAAARAGAALALLWARHPGLAPERLRALVLETAAAPPPEETHQLGQGILDLEAALAAAQAGP